MKSTFLSNFFNLCTWLYKNSIRGFTRFEVSRDLNVALATCKHILNAGMAKTWIGENNNKVIPKFTSYCASAVHNNAVVS